MSGRKKEEARLPVVEERLLVRKEEVETGRVRLASRVEEEDRRIRETLRRTDVRVERRPVDLLADEPPRIREEEDRLIVPVYEEVIVKRWRIREEVHLVAERSQQAFDETVTLRRNKIKVDRD